MTDSDTLLLCLSFGRNGGYVRQICLAYSVAPLLLPVFFHVSLLSISPSLSSACFCQVFDVAGSSV